jgi:hypothetical protein
MPNWFDFLSWISVWGCRSYFCLLKTHGKRLPYGPQVVQIEKKAALLPLLTNTRMEA